MDKAIWLGQAGLLFSHEGKTVIIDPYLSDSVGKLDPAKHRRVPVREEFLSCKPDILIFTHDHLDHYDPETVSHFLSENSQVTVLSPSSVWQKVRQLGGSQNNYVLFDRHTQWSQFGIRFRAVKAAHSDGAAIGVLMDDGQDTYYITGDTLYNEEIFPELPEAITAVFLPINGAGNNMNMVDAALFAARTRAKKVIPLHFGLFDDLEPGEFSCENKIIPHIFEEIRL